MLSHEHFTNWVVCVVTQPPSLHMSSNLPFLYAQMASSCCKGCHFFLRDFSTYSCVLSLHKGPAGNTGELRPQERPQALMNGSWGINTPAFLPVRWTNSESHLPASQLLVSDGGITLYSSFSCLSCFPLVLPRRSSWISQPCLLWCCLTIYFRRVVLPCFCQRKLRLFMICALTHGNRRSLSTQPISASQIRSSGLSFKYGEEVRCVVCFNFNTDVFVISRWIYVGWIYVGSVF